MTTVLVVDDRAISREIAVATLDDGGYDVVEASEGRQALALALAGHPDVVLTDVLMPGMDGYEFVHELRNDPATADIAVLFYTANYRADEAEPIATDLGVSRILSKDADPLELLKAVDEAVRNRPASPHAPADFKAQHVSAVNAKLLEKVQALDESEARFGTMADAAPIGIVFGGSHGMASYVNPRMSEITNTGAAELLGDGWQMCLTDRHRQALRVGADQVLDLGPEGLRFQENIELPDGQSRWLAVLLRTVHDSENAVTGFIAMIDDITAQVAAEERRRAEELEHEQEARQLVTARFDSLARLAGGVAHDFNNLLNVILSFGEFVKESVTDASGSVLSEERTQEILGDVDKIYNAAQRAADLAHRLLAFGGREVVKPGPVDVNALVGEVRGMIAGTLGQHLKITTKLDPALRLPSADSGQLSQVLMNLAANARDAMPDGGRLHFETANIRTETARQRGDLPPGDYVHIAVTDTGHGMSAEVGRHAIEPFYTTKPRGPGTGLGLATSYGIIKQAGGDLVIDSAPDHGTTVHIYLPATDEPVEGPEVVSTPTTAATGQTILLAEDEEGLRDAITRHLTRAGYHVLAAPNGREALNTAERYEGVIHAVLSDVVMPVMNGRELADALRQVRPDAPVLFMSGYAGPLMTEQGHLDPEVTVLGKPFTKPELLAAVHALVNQPRGTPLSTGNVVTGVPA